MPTLEREVLELLDRCADVAVGAAREVADWSAPGMADGQFEPDLVVDQAVREFLANKGVGVLSEESGPHDLNREVIVVVDPIDGSLNASRGIPFFGPSLYAQVNGAPASAVVANIPAARRWTALAGGGAWSGSLALRTSPCCEVGAAVVAVYGNPTSPRRWSASRSMGATALELALVAEGSLDAYVALKGSQVPAWDYLAGLLLVIEAGGNAADADGKDPWLVAADACARPFAATRACLLEELLRLADRAPDS